jgi:hypothetical protein
VNHTTKPVSAAMTIATAVPMPRQRVGGAVAGCSEPTGVRVGRGEGRTNGAGMATVTSGSCAATLTIGAAASSARISATFCGRSLGSTASARSIARRNASL